MQTDGYHFLLLTALAVFAKFVPLTMIRTEAEAQWITERSESRKE